MFFNEFPVQSHGFLNACDFPEVQSIGDSEAPHSIGMSPLLEMAFKGPASPIRVVPADFTLEFLVQTLYFVESVGNWLPVIADREVPWVVRGTFFLVRGRGLFPLLSFHFIPERLNWEFEGLFFVSFV